MWRASSPLRVFLSSHSTSIGRRQSYIVQPLPEFAAIPASFTYLSHPFQLTTGNKPHCVNNDMSDISTLGSALDSVVPRIWDSVPSRPSIDEMRNMVNSVPCTICAAMSIPEARSEDTDIITITSTEGSAQQPGPGREQVPPLSHEELLETLDKIPKTIPKGMKWGDLGWYLIFAEACVFAAGYAHSTRTGRSLIVTWTGEMPPSQVTPRPASPDHQIDRETWNSLMNVIKKLKPGDAKSLTPPVMLEVYEKPGLLAIAYLIRGEWVCKTYSAVANLVHTPTSPVAHDPLDNPELPDEIYSGASSDAEFSEDDPVHTPPGSTTGEDGLAATADV
jgi:hypothetical protein